MLKNKIVALGNPFLDVTAPYDVVRELLGDIDPYEYFGATKGSSDVSEKIWDFFMKTKIEREYPMSPGCTSANASYLIANLNEIEEKDSEVVYIGAMHDGHVLGYRFIHGTRDDGFPKGVTPLFINDTDQGPTCALVIIDNGERTFIKTPPVDISIADLTKEYWFRERTIRRAPIDEIREARILLLNGYDVMSKQDSSKFAIKEANKAGGFVVLDVANYGLFSRSMLDFCDEGLRYEMVVASGKIDSADIGKFFRKGTEIFINTLGEEGSVIYTRQLDPIGIPMVRSIRPFKNQNGAGDAYIGKFLHSLMPYLRDDGLDDLLHDSSMLHQMGLSASFWAGQVCGYEAARIPMPEIAENYVASQTYK
ncbi:MAG: carbohydrate kinase family protein [Candidatus Woesearchaeota archaeon]|nr:carbohydrate kinase family protein [Candidatus Woesearchaeota archaeon]